MTTSFSRPEMVLHAYGKVSAAGALTDGVNMAAPTKGAAGIYTLNLSSEIDATQRMVVLNPTGGIDARCATNGGTDATVVVNTFTGAVGTAADVAFEVAIFRVATPS